MWPVGWEALEQWGDDVVRSEPLTGGVGVNEVWSLRVNGHLALPVQLRHGARLIGRWEAEDGWVIAVWEYDDRGAYERIDAAVRANPDSTRAQQHRAELPPLITGQQETFMVSTTEIP